MTQPYPCGQCSTSRDHCAAEYHGCQRLDPPPRIFDINVFVGEGQQAALEIAIDDTAVLGKAEAPAQRPRQMPGQTGMED